MPKDLNLEAQLKAALEGEVRFDRVARALYATDASVYQMMPLGVVIPRSREDVLRTVRLCRAHGVSITARGGGTSQAGQAIGAGVQLDCSKYLNRVLEVNSPDEKSHDALVERAFGPPKLEVYSALEKKTLTFGT